MTKITLTPVAETQSSTTLAANINANSATIVSAIDNTLSRDGSTPNEMGATLDMNSNRIVNLPAAITSFEPVRVVDLTGGSAVTVNNLPTGGTTGQVLAKNTGTNYDVGWKSSGVPTGGTANQILKKNSGTDYDVSWTTPASLPSGFMTGPGSATDNAAVRFDSTTGALAQNSALLIADTTGALTRSGGGGIPIQGMSSNAAAVASGNIGEYLSNTVTIAGGFNLTSGSAGQTWNSLVLTAGTWMLFCSSGVYSSSGTATITHMHAGMGLNMASIPTAPTLGTVAMHVTSNNPNGWILTNNPYPVYLPAGGTINANMTADFTGGTVVAYGVLAALRIA